MMDVYAQRQGGAPDAYRFIFDGNRIVETATPDDVSGARRMDSLRCHILNDFVHAA